MAASVITRVGCREEPFWRLGSARHDDAPPASYCSPSSHRLSLRATRGRRLSLSVCPSHFDSLSLPHEEFIPRGRVRARSRHVVRRSCTNRSSILPGVNTGWGSEKEREREKKRETTPAGKARGRENETDKEEKSNGRGAHTHTYVHKHTYRHVGRVRGAETKAYRVREKGKQKNRVGKEKHAAMRNDAPVRDTWNVKTWKLQNLTRWISLKIVDTPRAETERGDAKTLLRESRYVGGTSGEEAARGEAKGRRVRDERRGFVGRRLGTTCKGREREVAKERESASLP